MQNKKIPDDMVEVRQAHRVEGGEAMMSDHEYTVGDRVRVLNLIRMTETPCWRHTINDDEMIKVEPVTDCTAVVSFLYDDGTLTIKLDKCCTLLRVHASEVELIPAVPTRASLDWRLIWLP